MALSESYRRFLSSPWSLVVGVLPIFAALCFFNALHHEMWRDELEPWNLAVRSGSITELFENIRYQGHGALWYLLLFLITRFTSDPTAMQVVHILIATATAGLLLRFLPCSPLCRILVVFGYVPFYEFATISRGYALEFLLLVSFCAVATRAPNAFLAQAMLLVLLAQTEAYGVILAVCLAVFTAIRVRNRERIGDLSLPIRRRAIGAAILLLLGIGVGVQQLIPPTNRTPFGRWFFELSIPRLFDTLSTPWRGLVPFPKLYLHFWNSNFLDGPVRGLEFRSTLPEIIFGVGLCVLVALMLSRHADVLLFFLLSATSLLVFTYVKHIGDLRHHGQYWIVVLAAYWFWSFSKPRPQPQRGVRERVSQWFERRWGIVLMTLSLAGFAAGIAANVGDGLRPFSASGMTAHFLRVQNSDLPVVADPNYTTSAVAMHLNRPFFYPMGNRWGTFCRWDEVGTRLVSPEQVALAVKRVSEESGRDVIVLLGYPARGPLLGYEKLAAFPAGIVSDEGYFVYLARFRRGNGS